MLKTPITRILEESMRNESKKFAREERITQFKKVYKEMLATSDESYNTYEFTKYVKPPKEYDAEEVQAAIEGGVPSKLREMSMYYFYASPLYRKFIMYYAGLMKYSTLIIPHVKEGSKIEDSAISKKYYEALDYFDRMNFIQMCQNFSIKVLSEGCYYGLLREGEEGVTIHDLPYRYCRTRFKNYAGIDLVEFDVTYFDSIYNETDREEALDAYPKEIKKRYRKYHNDTGKVSKWIILEDGVGIYFNLYEEKPYLFNAIPSILDLNEYKQIEKEKDMQDLNTIFVEKMPLGKDGEFFFELEEIEEMHKGLVKILSKNKGMDVVTTFGDVSVENLQSNRQTTTNSLEQAATVAYNEAGVSKQVISADGNLSTDKSIQNTLSVMVNLTVAYQNWLAFILNKRIANKKIRFSAEILTITWYNEKDYIADKLKSAQYGYSFLLAGIAGGLSQTQIVSIKNLENKLLKMADMLEPLKSSSTQSGDAAEGGGETKDGTATEKPTSEKSDKTIANQESKGGSE